MPDTIVVPKGDYYPLFKFLISARSKDENRFVLQRVYCDEKDDSGVLVACDGMTVHVLYNVWHYNFEKGTMYNVVEGKDKIAFVPVDEKDEYHYPNWKSVIPNTDNYSSFEFESKGCSNAAEFAGRILYLLGENGGAFVKTEYLKRLWTLGNFNVKYSKDDPLKPIVASGLFREETEFLAVMMPYRLDDENK